MTLQRSYIQYTINSIRKLVRLAQVVEQWTGNPEKKIVFFSYIQLTASENRLD